MPPPVYEDELLGKAWDSGLARKAASFVRPYWKQILVCFIVMLLTAAAGLTSPWLQGYAIDKGILRKYVVHGKTVHGDMRLLVIIAGLYVSIWLFYWLMQFVQTRLISKLGQTVLFDIRHKLFEHIQNMSLDFFDRREIGRLISRLTSDVGAVNQFLTSASLSMLTDLLTLVGVVIIMLMLDCRLATLTFLSIPVIMVVMMIFRGKARLAYRDVRRKVATVTATVAENVSGVREVKSFSREKENLRRFKQINSEQNQAVMQAVRVSAVIWPSIELVRSIAVGTILCVGGSQVLRGLLTAGIVWSFIGYVDRFFQPLQNISQFYYTMQSAMAGAERIFEILGAGPTVTDKPGAHPLPPIGGEVEFRNVTFGYGAEPVLKDLSFAVRSGETIALVGPTGAGKTTITSLIPRQYHIQEGSITIDGVDIRDATMISLRRQVGMVLQDSFLFPGTVKDNIRYGRLDATDQEIEAAARELGAHEFIQGLPRGYRTEIQEGGANISTGQKQLLSFVRALLANPRILVLDEATSSIDTYTEMVIQEALRRLFDGRTSFVVAHRLSTIAEADRILVIEAGRIAESGTHDELLEKKGLYRRLHDVQFSFLSSEDGQASVEARQSGSSV